MKNKSDVNPTAAASPTYPTIPTGPDTWEKSASPTIAELIKPNKPTVIALVIVYVCTLASISAVPNGFLIVSTKDIDTPRAALSGEDSITPVSGMTATVFSTPFTS